MTATPDASIIAPIIAKAGFRYRMTRYIVTLVLFGGAAYSAYDGFHGFREPYYTQNHPNQKPKNAWEIGINEAMAFILPPVAIALLIYSLHHSRGQFHLESSILTAPGHPPIPLDAIQSVDRSRWDRKGIAVLHYKTPDHAGRIVLDDFVYEQDPIDKIFKAAEQVLTHSTDKSRPANMLQAKLPPRPRIGS